MKSFVGAGGATLAGKLTLRVLSGAAERIDTARVGETSGDIFLQDVIGYLSLTPKSW